jgi:MoxR-like ATPase
MSDINAKTFKSKLDAGRRMMGQIIVGNDKAILATLIALICGKPVLLTSMRGRGKTALSLAFQKFIIGASAARLQGTPELMPGSITGREIFDEKIRDFAIRLSAAMLADVVLFDEINRMMEESQAALMELLEEGQATIEGKAHMLPTPNLWICTRNPDGQAGTYRLADPTRDRFLLDVDMTFPGENDMVALLSNTDIHRGKANVTGILEKEEILQMQQYNDWMVRNVPDAVKRYAYRLAQIVQVDQPEFKQLKLRPTTDYDKQRLQDLSGQSIVDLEILEDGISPRATIWLMHSACALAFIEGEEKVSHEHVRRVFIPSARHKLIMRPVAKSLRVLPEDILNAALDTIKF